MPVPRNSDMTTVWEGPWKELELWPQDTWPREPPPVEVRLAIGGNRHMVKEVLDFRLECGDLSSRDAAKEITRRVSEILDHDARDEVYVQATAYIEEEEEVEEEEVEDEDGDGEPEEEDTSEDEDGDDEDDEDDEDAIVLPNA